MTKPRGPEAPPIPITRDRVSGVTFSDVLLGIAIGFIVALIVGPWL